MTNIKFDIASSLVQRIEYKDNLLYIYRTDSYYNMYSLVGVDLSQAELYLNFTDKTQKVVFSNNSAALSVTREVGWIVGDSAANKINLAKSKAGFNLALGQGHDVIVTGGGTDQLYGGEGNDQLNAGAGNDQLFGGAGDDILMGGTGNDLLNGGQGNNTYIFSRGDGVDKIDYDNKAFNTYQDQRIIELKNIQSTDVYFSFKKGALLIHYTAKDYVEITDYLTVNNNNITLKFADKTISASALDAFVGVQYWVKNLAVQATLAYETTVYYHFAKTPPSYLAETGSSSKHLQGWQALSSQGQQLAKAAFAEISKYTTLKFVETNDPNQSNVITLQANDQSSQGSAGYAYFPSIYNKNLDYQMDVFIDVRSQNNQHVMIHEIGHTLGLDHTFENGVSKFTNSAEDSTSWSRMSYQIRDYKEFEGLSLKPFDIAALQALYGVNASYNAGNTSHQFNTQKGVLIADGSGTDSIDASQASSRAVIDLAEGSWSYIGTKSSSITAANQLSINIETQIEHAIGTDYNDILYGNALNNQLKAGLGNDQLYGGAGNDILDGGAGADALTGGVGNDSYYVDNAKDRVIEKSGEGTDGVYASISYTLTDHVENLLLLGTSNLNATGNALANKLYGNDGKNILDGGLGADRMTGGKGNDTYFVDNAKDIVVEKSGEGTDGVRSSVSYKLTDHVENLALLGTSNINATGNALANKLYGNDGKNILDGGLGADRMTGGKGNDTYFVDNAKDIVVEKSGEGTDGVRSSVSYKLTGHVENLALLGTSNLNATGNSLANKLYGNDGKNILDGGAGNDTFSGGAGEDTVLYRLLNSKDARGGNGQDTWSDFAITNVKNSVVGDKIDVSDLLIDFEQDKSLSYIEQYLTVKTSKKDMLVYLDRDGANSQYTDTLLITLKNVNTSLKELIEQQQFILV